MKHRWIEKKDGRKTYQVCLRCGVKREKEPVRALIAITQTEPFYHYRYESRWSYMIGNRKTMIRPDCPALEPKLYAVNEVENIIDDYHG